MILYLAIYFAFSIYYFVASKRDLAHPHYFLWAMLTLALIVGLSDMLGGYDRYGYCELFDRCADFIYAGKNPFVDDNPIMNYQNEMSYVVLNVLIGHVTSNRYIFILILTLVAYAMLYDSLRRYVNSNPFALLLFMGLFFFFTFTYLRQVMATCFTWYAFRYVIKKQFIPFALCAFIAYRFHNSAIIFFPIYFLPARKFSKRTIVYVLLGLLVIGATGLPSNLYSVYGDISGSDSRTGQYVVYGQSFRLEYVLEVGVFLWLILKQYDKIPEDREHLVFLNASLVFFAVLLFFVTSSSAGRQTWYFMIGLIYTLTYLVSLKKIAFDKYKIMIYLLTTVLYLRIVWSWGVLISPYKTFLTDGHRPGDVIYFGYEYDEYYEKDKLYRPLFYLK